MTRKPNIIFILTDDQGYGDLECTGNDIVKTPNINKLHDESVRLTNYHVGPTCAPTRSGLMTGHYANSTGVWHTVGGRSLLRKDEWTLATALQKNNYRTGIFGKWHLGDTYPYRPMDRGFETTIVHGGGGISQSPDFWGNDYFDDTYMVNGKLQKFSGYCTDVFFEESMKYIEKNKDEQFFCYIACNAPHSPFNVHTKYSDPYKDKTVSERSKFYGMITNIDENIGKLREKLKELDLDDNTILIFMTDNGSACGCSLDENGFVKGGYNAGYRGMKNSEYDGGHRVPYFFHWPKGKLTKGVDVNTLNANVDFMPTLLDLCDIEPQDRKFHGKSIRPLLYQEDDIKEFEDRIIVTDSQRLLTPVKWRKSASMKGEWRLINGNELYNVAEDREQHHDISAKHPEIVKELRAGYDTWWDTVSQRFDEAIPLSIGEVPVILNTHDSINETSDCAWNQKMVRKGYEAVGYYEVLVEKDGFYSFQLRRWPKEADREINRGIEGDDVSFERDFISEHEWDNYTGGRALPISKASIEINDIKESKEVIKEDKYIEFKVELKAGITLFNNLFEGANDLKLTPFYTYVEYLGTKGGEK